MSTTLAAARVDLPIIGMHCAGCAGRIEKALGTAAGVSRAAVNFATGRATVEYNPETGAIPNSSTASGYLKSHFRKGWEL